MIVELAETGGQSFKGLGTYLLHDPDKAKTSERVAWTHTLNLAQDHPGHAVDEMLWTYRGADYLKREAGIKASGRKLEYPVKHFSLNWHPSEFPNKAHMIETAEKLLKRLGWNEHQALLVCHNDKAHNHIHVMLNVVHPQTGKALNNDYEKRRISDWARDYEFERGRIFCHQRVIPFEQRDKTPTRDAWAQVKGIEQDYSRIEVERLAKQAIFFARHDPAERKDREWIALKSRQREEREQFFMQGKETYRQVRNAVFREVRGEFRPEWRDWYADKRNGLSEEALNVRKRELLAAQKAMLDDRVKLAFEQLRGQRDKQYAQLRKTQEQDKSELRVGQKRGERIYDELAAAGSKRATAQQPEMSGNAAETKSEFRRTATEITRNYEGEAPENEEKPERREREVESDAPNEHFKVRDGMDAVSGIGLGALGAIAKIGERLFDGFIGNDGPAKPPKPAASPPPGRAPSEEERERARNAAEAKAAAEALDAEAAALVAYWEMRRQRRRERGVDRD